MSNISIIDTGTRRLQGVDYDVAIFETEHGARIYAEQGRGELETHNGVAFMTHRWQFVVGFRALCTDTLANLDAVEDGFEQERADVALAGHDQRRPTLDMTGIDVESIFCRERKPFSRDGIVYEWSERWQGHVRRDGRGDPDAHPDD